MSSHSHKSIKILAAVALVFLMLGTLVGMFWMFQNFIFVPQYGDTNEYLPD